jgi:hypothetical protein
MSKKKKKGFIGKLKDIFVGGGDDKKNEQPQGEALVRRFPQLTKEQRAERVAVIRAANRDLNTLSASVRREFASIDNWKQLSGSKASVVSIIVAAIQRVDSASDVLMNKATQTVRQEIYAIEEWPTTKRVVLSRATASIRRLKLGGRLA